MRRSSPFMFDSHNFRAPRRISAGRLFPTGLLTALLVGTAGLLSGCAVVESGQEMMRESFKIFKPRQTDYRDTTLEGDDNWEAVGKEARGNRALESQNDPIRDWTMSPKARSIERNLGFE